MPIIDTNKRIAKNTIVLYFRMLVNMAVGLYTSRIVLSTLGVVDYGIYNVIGGVVLMFAFLNTTLSGATSRFLTFELGKQNLENLKKTFSSALTIHIGVALIILVLAETIGLWFLENKLNIPEGRMLAARIVYQFSILSSMISVTQVPYNASIISHERMDVFAYVSILDGLLKLLIVFLLFIGEHDKLIVYAILLFVVTTLIALIYRFYCTRNYEECHYKFEYDKQTLKPLLQFSGWDLYGNLSVVACVQGMNILLNLFFGPTVNAAAALGNQVRNAVSGFSANFLTAVQPQMVKEFAQNNLKSMSRLVINSSKYSFVLSYILYFPLILENKFALSLWLIEVPDFTVIFCQLTLIYSLIGALVTPINMAIHATGKIKFLSLATGSLFLITLPISYVLLRLGYSPVYPFIVNIVIFILAYFSNLLILRKNVNEFSIRLMVKKVLVPCLLLVLSSIPIPLFAYYEMTEGWLRFMTTSILSVFLTGIMAFFIILDRDMRMQVAEKVKNKIAIFRINKK